MKRYSTDNMTKIQRLETASRTKEERRERERGFGSSWL